MSVEAKRGCGWRKIGGLYLVGGGVSIHCDRLPFELTTCPCCSQGVKQARGFTWIDMGKLFNGPHMVIKTLQPVEFFPGKIIDLKHNFHNCPCHCPLCSVPETLGRAGLLWVGSKFYKTPADFIKEGGQLGFSRRIKTVPQGFKIGETYIMLAHSKAVKTLQPHQTLGEGEIGITDPVISYKPGIFYAWLPNRLEKIVKESTRDSEEVKALEKRGITPVFVPDDDPDHQGNVHDDFENEKKKQEEAS